MRKIVIPVSLLLCISACKKETPVKTGYSSWYHINGNDTVSALYIPNSFSPIGKGVNNVFHPVTAGCTGQNYLLEVRNRNETIFQTKEVNSYWDGTSKGIKSPGGKYNYTVVVTDTTGYSYNVSGEVYLVR